MQVQAFKLYVWIILTPLLAATHYCTVCVMIMDVLFFFFAMWSARTIVHVDWWYAQPDVFSNIARIRACWRVIRLVRLAFAARGGCLRPV